MSKPDLDPKVLERFLEINNGTNGMHGSHIQSVCRAFERQRKKLLQEMIEDYNEEDDYIEDKDSALMVELFDHLDDFLERVRLLPLI